MKWYTAIGEGVQLRRSFGARFGSSGGGFVRLDNQLYAEGSQHLISQYVDNPIFETATDLYISHSGSSGVEVE